MTLKFWSSFFCLPRAEIIGGHHHVGCSLSLSSFFPLCVCILKHCRHGLELFATTSWCWDYRRASSHLALHMISPNLYESHFSLACVYGFLVVDKVPLSTSSWLQTLGPLSLPLKYQGYRHAAPCTTMVFYFYFCFYWAVYFPYSPSFFPLPFHPPPCHLELWM